MKSAIMPVEGLQGPSYVELICVEMPEVRFEDVMVFSLRDNKPVSKRIDATFLKVCEDNSIQPVGIVPSRPVKVGAYIKDSKVFVEVDDADPVEVVVKISGLRRGMGDRRFASHTREEMVKNNAFWDQWSK